MIYSPSPVVAAKNQWLSSQVDVEFPTAQSLEGRDIYHALSLHTEVSLFQPQACDAPLLQEIYLVDFHRLTVWFALLQATRSSTQHDQERLVEFFYPNYLLTAMSTIPRISSWRTRCGGYGDGA